MRESGGLRRSRRRMITPDKRWTLPRYYRIWASMSTAGDIWPALSPVRGEGRPRGGKGAGREGRQRCGSGGGGKRAGREEAANVRGGRRRCGGRVRGAPEPDRRGRITEPGGRREGVARAENEAQTRRRRNPCSIADWATPVFKFQLSV